jgi:type IV secretion system protein VirB9
VSENPDGHADLKIFVHPTDTSAVVAMHSDPKFISADAVVVYKKQAEDARAQLAAERVNDDQKLAKERVAMQAAYPAMIRHDYRYSVPTKNPFNVTAIYHDDRFTYIEAKPEEAPSVYEVKDGKASLIQYEFKDGLYTIPKILDDGYLRVGKAELKFHRESAS